MNLDIFEKNIQKRGCSITLTMDPFNKRVRVDDYLGHFTSCVEEALLAADEISAEKLIFKVRMENVMDLLNKGFLYEAMINEFYLGSDCHFLVKYFSVERRTSEHWIKEDEIIQNVAALPKHVSLSNPPQEYEVRKATTAHATMLAELYRTVFEVYPTPMNDPEYIRKCIKGDTVFYMYMYDGKIVSAASAEIDRVYHNAEITDCATLPEHRQFGLMKHLIVKLEEELLAQEIYCVYSIARALSFGMNAALYQQGYEYRGRLANNCYIFDKLEDMNMWVKKIV